MNRPDKQAPGVHTAAVISPTQADGASITLAERNRQMNQGFDVQPCVHVRRESASGLFSFWWNYRVRVEA